jgi:hypothetical protein
MQAIGRGVGWAAGHRRLLPGHPARSQKSRPSLVRPFASGQSAGVKEALGQLKQGKTRLCCIAKQAGLLGCCRRGSQQTPGRPQAGLLGGCQCGSQQTPGRPQAGLLGGCQRESNSRLFLAAGLAGRPTVDPAYLNGATFLKSIGFTNQVSAQQHLLRSAALAPSLEPPQSDCARVTLDRPRSLASSTLP